VTAHPLALARMAAPRGGLDAVIGCMLLAPADEPLQHAGCVALAAMVVTPENNARAVAGGGIEASLGAMRGHGASAAVQAAGGRALYALAFETDNFVMAWEKAAAEPQGLPLLWRAFCAHAKALSPAEHVTGAAAAARRGADAAVRAVAKSVDARMLKAAAEGSLQAFVAAMLAHVGDTIREGGAALKATLAKAAAVAPPGLKGGLGGVSPAAQRKAPKPEDA
jgi:hypothetical protein